MQLSSPIAATSEGDPLEDDGALMWALVSSTICKVRRGMFAVTGWRLVDGEWRRMRLLVTVEQV